MRLYMRNKQSGEIRDVEADSPEFRDLQRQVTPGGLSMWEQTHFPHAEAIKSRAANGELLEDDLGKDDKEDLRYAALQLDADGVGPESNPHLALTPGEIEVGLTPSQKLKDLQAMHDMKGVQERFGVFERAADRIADERVAPEQAQPARGQLARAGGSDDREGVPPVRYTEEGEKEAPKSRQSKTGARASSQPAVSQAAQGSGEEES